MTITLLFDQDKVGGFENKARVRELPFYRYLQHWMYREWNRKKQNKKKRKLLNAGNDTYNGLNAVREQIELVLREKEKILEEARKRSGSYWTGSKRKGRTYLWGSPGFERIWRRQTKGWVKRDRSWAEEENEAKHHENQRFFLKKAWKALIEINKEKKENASENIWRIKKILLWQWLKKPSISAWDPVVLLCCDDRSWNRKTAENGLGQEILYGEDYETMVQSRWTSGREKLSRLSDNVKFIVMEDGKCRKLYHQKCRTGS